MSAVMSLDRQVTKTRSQPLRVPIRVSADRNVRPVDWEVPMYTTHERSDELGGCWIIEGRDRELRMLRRRVWAALGEDELQHGAGLLSKCRNPCVRPDHLLQLTPEQAFDLGYQHAHDEH